MIYFPHYYEAAGPTFRAPEARQWLAAYTNSCQEKRVAEHCQAREIESFLPVYRSSRRWRNGCTVDLEKPLFSSYVFVRIRQTERVRVLELPGVVSIVGAGRQPTPLPDTDIEALRSGLPLTNAEPHRYPEIGDRVRITRGPFEGMAGILVRKKNSVRVILTLDVIMRSISVEVEGKNLEVLNSESILSSSLQFYTSQVHQ